MPIENVGIKLYFNGDVTHDSVWGANSSSRVYPLPDPEGNEILTTKMFTLTDPDGNYYPTEAFPGQKDGEEGYILVVARPVPAVAGQPGQLAQSTVYTLTISGELAAVGGARLGEEIRISFETMDMSANARFSMIIMVVMMVGVIVLMFVTNMRKMKAEAEAAALAKANPYRIAKEKNISVDDAKALIEKAKERNQKQLEKTGGKAPEPVEKTSAAPRLDSKKKAKKTHKVKGARPVSEGGSSFKTGRKGLKARKARADAARKAAAAGPNRQGSGSKKGKGKGKGKGKRR